VFFELFKIKETEKTAIFWLCYTRVQQELCKEGRKL